MKRFFAIIIILTAGAFLISPGVSHALYHDGYTLTVDPLGYDGFDEVFNEDNSLAARIYYVTEGNVTRYQIHNINFDPKPTVPPVLPSIGELFLYTDTLDPADYTFGTEEPDYVGVIEEYDFVDPSILYFVRFVFSDPWGEIGNPNLQGLPVGKYSGIFTVTTDLTIGVHDTILGELWDGGEFTEGNIAFPLTIATDDPGTPIPEPLTVSIDIKPGSDPNSINPKSEGKIPVAILSTMDFYAPAEIETESLTFGATGDEHSLAFCNPSPEDVNNDGYDDLLCHFYTQETGFQCGDEEGILKGQTVDEVPIEGSDSVDEVPIEGSDSVRIVPSACKG